jgi:hypothetical protein
VGGVTTCGAALDKFRHLRKSACGMPLYRGLREAAIGLFKSSLMRANHFVPAQAKAIGGRCFYVPADVRPQSKK